MPVHVCTRTQVQHVHTPAVHTCTSTCLQQRVCRNLHTSAARVHIPAHARSHACTWQRTHARCTHMQQACHGARVQGVHAHTGLCMHTLCMMHPAHSCTSAVPCTHAEHTHTVRRTHVGMQVCKGFVHTEGCAGTHGAGCNLHAPAPLQLCAHALSACTPWGAHMWGCICAMGACR